MKNLFLAMLCLVAMTIQATERPELIGGDPVPNKKDFDAVVYSSMGNASCSSTIIGPLTLLMAAHCVSDGGKATFTAQDGKKYAGVCTHSPQYEQAAWQRLHDELLKVTPLALDLFTANSTADWALCKLDKEVTNVTFETMELGDAPLKVGDTPLLCGYGCISPGGGGGNDGILRTNRATVQSLPGGASNDVVTKGKAALCFGDSGGPFFCTNGNSLTDRKVCGVNSRGNISDTSYLSATFTPMAKAFFQDWKTKNGVKICGYDKLPQCRGAVPPGPSQFTLESTDVVLKATIQTDAGYTSEQAKAALQNALDSLGAK